MGAVGLLILFAGCGDDDPEPVVDLGAVDVDVDHHLRLDDDGFTPGELVVAEGDVVRIVNDGAEPERIRAGTRFDLGDVHPGEAALVLFDRTGEHEVQAGPHTARLVVVPGAGDDASRGDADRRD